MLAITVVVSYQRAAELLGEINAVHQLAINVQLDVLYGAVTNANWPRTFVTSEMRELDLW